MNNDPLDEIVMLAKAISEANRIKILYALKDGELCACQIIDYLGLAGSTVSRHLEILKHAGMVESDKRGRWVYFRLKDTKSPLLSAIISQAQSSFHNSAEFRKTEKLLNKICSESGSETCR
jgi:ArsR family transcriptional regulator